MVPARQRPGLGDLHAGSQAKPGAQGLAEPRAQPVALGERQRRRRVNADQDVVEALVAPEHDVELVDLRVRPHELLDPPRVDDDPAHLLHVVEAGEHPALEGDQRAPAGARAVGRLDDVARPVADEGHGLAVEAREDQLAAPAGADRPIPLVQHLGIAVILVDVGQAGPRVALEAPRRDLRETGQVVGLGPERRLDPGPGRGDGGAGLSRVPRDADLRLLGELSFPVVIKPANKEAFYLGRTERIRKVNALDEAIAVCTRALPNAGKVIVQEWIAGPDSNIYFCLFYRGKDGVIVSSFTGQKILSDPPEIGGTAICLAAPEVRNAIEPVTMAFADRVGFDGMGSLEFKWDPERARFVIIEPTVGRVDWQEEIATLCGVNIPLIAYRHETGLAPISVDRVPEDVAWRVSFIKRWPKQRSRSGTRVYDGYWRLDDPGPAVFYYVFYCTLEAIKKYALKPLLSAWNSGVIR